MLKYVGVIGTKDRLIEVSGDIICGVVRQDKGPLYAWQQFQHDRTIFPDAVAVLLSGNLIEQLGGEP